MKMQVTATTDGRYIGHEFDSEDNPIQLTDDVSVYIDTTMVVPNGTRFINTSYIIDAQGV